MENEAKIERIKTLMENFGVTQSEFAKRISIDASNFSKQLTGKLPVSDSLINRIVADLGVSKEWLCTGKGYMLSLIHISEHTRLRRISSLRQRCTLSYTHINSSLGSDYTRSKKWGESIRSGRNRR